MEAWKSQARAAHSDMKGYSVLAAAYAFKDESGNPVTSMDGINRVFAHYNPKKPLTQALTASVSKTTNPQPRKTFVSKPKPAEQPLSPVITQVNSDGTVKDRKSVV
jgi:hypothetical protein